MVGVQAPQALFQLRTIGLVVPSMILGHEEHSLAIAIAQRPAHEGLTAPLMVAPSIVHQVYAVVDGGAYDLYRYLVTGSPGDVIPTHTYDAELDSR